MHPSPFHPQIALTDGIGGIDDPAPTTPPAILTLVQDIAHRLAGPDEQVLVVTAPRDLGHEAADAVRDCVVRHIPNRDGVGVVLDMQGVAMISSIGIAALLQIAEACKDRQAGLILAALSDRQLGFLKMLRLDRKFTTNPSLDDAIAALATR